MTLKLLSHIRLGKLCIYGSKFKLHRIINQEFFRASYFRLENYLSYHYIRWRLATQIIKCGRTNPFSWKENQHQLSNVMDAWISSSVRPFVSGTIFATNGIINPENIVNMKNTPSKIQNYQTLTKKKHENTTAFEHF